MKKMSYWASMHAQVNFLILVGSRHLGVMYTETVGFRPLMSFNIDLLNETKKKELLPKSVLQKKIFHIATSDIGPSAR